MTATATENAYYSLADAARLLGYPPRTIPDILYRNLLRRDELPTVAGRKVVPASMLPRVAEILAAAKVRRA